MTIIQIIFVWYVLPMIICYKYAIAYNYITNQKIFSDPNGFMRMGYVPALNILAIGIIFINIVIYLFRQIVSDIKMFKKK